MKDTILNFFYGFVITLLIIFIGFVCFALHTQDARAKEPINYTAATARTILRVAAGLEVGNSDYDIDGDRKVTAADARIALRRAAKLSDYPAPTTTTTTIVTTTVAPTTIPTTEPTTEKKYYQIGVLSTCSLTESQLYNGLKRNLKQHAWAFLEAERQYNVNAVFLSAVAALESGWGTSSVARNRNNFFGWKGQGGYRYFDTPAEGIIYVAKHLRNNYLTPGGGCFHGYNIEDIAICYCPGGGWASQVKSLMRTIENGAY